MTGVLRGAEAIHEYLGLRSTGQVAGMARKGKLTHFREGRLICTTPALNDKSFAVEVMLNDAELRHIGVSKRSIFADSSMS